MKKEEWRNKGKELQAKFDAKPCMKTATTLSNAREELKKYNNYYGSITKESQKEN